MALSPTLRTRQAMRRITKISQGFCSDRKAGNPRIIKFCSAISNNGDESAFSSSSKVSPDCQIEKCGLKCSIILNKSLNQGGDIGFSIGLSVRERRQVEQGGAVFDPRRFCG